MEQLWFALAIGLWCAFGLARRRRGVLRRKARGRVAPAAPARSPSRAATGRGGRPWARSTMGVLLGFGCLVGVVVVGPVVAVGIVVVVGLARAALVRDRRRRSAVARARALPDLIDLFGLAASAGLPVASALGVVAPRAPPVLRDAVGRAAEQMARGASVAAALDGLAAELGPGGPEFARALAAAARTGMPLVAALRQLSEVARDRRARSAEEAARRLPVTLLFPLTCCILPAAVLLALVPVLAASLGSLGH